MILCRQYSACHQPGIKIFFFVEYAVAFLMVGLSFLKTIELYQELIDEWEKRGIIKKRDFAILTDEIIRAVSSNTTRLKGNHGSTQWGITVTPE